MPILQVLPWDLNEWSQIEGSCCTHSFMPHLCLFRFPFNGATLGRIPLATLTTLPYNASFAQASRAYLAPHKASQHREFLTTSHNCPTSQRSEQKRICLRVSSLQGYHNNSVYIQSSTFSPSTSMRQWVRLGRWKHFRT